MPGRIIILIGVIVVIIGILVSTGAKIPYLGRLPGDIHIKRDNFTFYFPIATSVILSIIASVILYLIGRR